MPATFQRLLPVVAATLVTTIGSAQNLVMPDNCNLFGPTVSTSTWRSTAGRSTSTRAVQRRVLGTWYKVGLSA